MGDFLSCTAACTAKGENKAFTEVGSWLGIDLFYLFCFLFAKHFHTFAFCLSILLFNQPISLTSLLLCTFTQFSQPCFEIACGQKSNVAALTVSALSRALVLVGLSFCHCYIPYFLESISPSSSFHLRILFAALVTLSVLILALE